jgi:hypothetical protein
MAFETASFRHTPAAAKSAPDRGRMQAEMLGGKQDGGEALSSYDNRFAFAGCMVLMRCIREPDWAGGG